MFLFLHRDELINEPHNDHHQIHLDFPLPKFIGNTPIIFLCRNPYKRVVSMFCDKYCGPLHTLREKIPMDNITFRNFVYKLRELKNSDKLNKLDVHIFDQQHQLIDIDNENVTIIKLEDFDNSIIKVFGNFKLNLLPQIKNFIKINKATNTTRRNCETVLVCDKKYELNSNIYPECKYFYDKELYDLVYEIYKDDFVKYGYNPSCI